MNKKRTGVGTLERSLTPLLLGTLLAIAAWNCKTVIDLQIAVTDLKSAVTHVMRKMNEPYPSWK